MFKIVIDNWASQEYYCRDGQSLLDAARSVFVPIPTGCRGGGCGMCKIQVLEGQFEQGTCSKAVLSDQERAANYSLACKTYPLSDLKISVGS